MLPMSCVTRSGGFDPERVEHAGDILTLCLLVVAALPAPEAIQPDRKNSRRKRMDEFFRRECPYSALPALGRCYRVFHLPCLSLTGISPTIDRFAPRGPSAVTDSIAT